MSDFRIKFGFAMGPYGTEGTLGITSAGNTFTSGDATPDVTLGSYWLTNNTSATTITDFDGRLTGGITGIEEGKVLEITFGDGNTTLTEGANIRMTDSGNTFEAGDSIRFINHAGRWDETTRSVNPAGGVVTVTDAGSIGLSVTGVKVVLLVTTAATATLAAFTGGYIGQEVTVVLNTGAVATRISNTGGATDNIAVAGTAWTTLQHHAAYRFVKIGSGTRADQWCGIPSFIGIGSV